MEQKSDALDSLYGLVGDVYKVKLKNGEYTLQNYTDYQSALDDVLKKMKSSNQSEHEKYATWTPKLKETHKNLTSYFNDGLLSFRDINMKKIQDMGEKIIKNLENEVSEEFKKIKESLYKEVKNDLQALENVLKSAENEASSIIHSISSIFGGH